MASFYAELHVQGHMYPVLRCRYSCHQSTGARGRANAKVRHGPLELWLDVPDGDFLTNWAATPHKPLAGDVVFYDIGEHSARETISFAEGHLVHYGEEFAPGDTGDGAYRCRLVISAERFELLKGGPAKPLQVAAAVQRLSQAETPTPGLTSTPLPKPDVWLDELETVMGPGADVRTLVATWVAGGLDKQKLGSFVAAAADKKLVFERLAKADTEKGVYQQRVVIDDYDNIPGVSKQPYNGGNSLPQKKLLANDFLSEEEREKFAKTNKYGKDNEDLDLPDYRTATFTREAKLIKLEPGKPLYRVTDPGGEGGPWWTLEPPKDLSEVIGGTAVMPEWNGFRKVVKATVPDDGEPFFVWFGPAAAQPVSGNYPEKKNNGYSLAGGTEQVFLPNPTKNNAAFKDSFKDDSTASKSW